MDGKYYNLWSTDNDRTDANDDVVIKSVYDPSPVGYSLPASNAFTGFTLNGQNTEYPGDPNMYNVNETFDKGWYFYTKPNKSGKIFFFPASGWRYHNPGIMYEIIKRTHYWAAASYSTDDGRNLVFSSFHIYCLDNSGRNAGFCVRSAEEKKWKYVCCMELQCADFRYASSSPRTAWVPSIYDVMDDTVTHCNSYNTQKV